MKVTFLFPTLSEVPPSLHIPKMRGGELYKLDHCQVLCTGPGREIETSLERFKKDLKDTFLLLLGYGGALLPDLNTGDLVACRKSMYAEKNPLAFSKATNKIFHAVQNSGLPIRMGNSFTASTVVKSKEMKQNMAKQGAKIVEMESYFALQKALQWGMPLSSLRIVLDRWEEELPNMMDTITPKGEISSLGILWHLIRFPHHLSSMLKIFRSSHKILARLAQACSIVISILK